VFDHDGGPLRAAKRTQRVDREEAVEKLNRNRALANCRCHAIRGTVSCVAGREHSGHAGFEQKRTAIERPSRVVAKIRSRKNETMLVPGDVWWKPFSVRARSDHEQERVGVDGLLASVRTISKHEVLQPPVAPTTDDLGPEADLHPWRRLHLADQIMRHPYGERLRADHERDAPGVTSEVKGSLSS
jgi:hypothetical protein